MNGELGWSPAVISGYSVLKSVQWHGVAKKDALVILAAVSDAAQNVGSEETHLIIRNRGTATSCGSPSYWGMSMVSLEASLGSKKR